MADQCGDENMNSSLAYLTPTTRPPHRTSLLCTIGNIDWLIVLNAVAIIDPFRFRIIETSHTAHTDATIACGRTRSPSARSPFVIVSTAE